MRQKPRQRDLDAQHIVQHLYGPRGSLTQRAQLEEWVRHATNLSAARKEAARRQLAASGEGDRLCHGDFHPGNILLSPRGPIIIDWETATRGHPLADVAATSVLFECANLPLTTSLHARVLMKLFRNLLHSAYLKRYLQLRGGSLVEIALWRVPQRAGIADLLST